MTRNITEEELERMAAKELLKEAEIRENWAKVEGPSAYKVRRIARTNQVFLRQTVKNVVRSNLRMEKKT
ncbi:Hypothetical protein NTJ_06109 [Nesidiocoris tenuis]|uniref:Uncharacterized protein n=1 Tax=Nesidiocoris tenuis TaxID=355587 RepID=A0ABN7AQV9_9HEMI|nr:Hypothetical protein NTJ_06109 [Nesidiocoris tenuis]